MSSTEDPNGDEIKPKSVRLTRQESTEYNRLIQMLDYRQHLNLSAHLYSAFLLSKKNQNRNLKKKQNRDIPYTQWTAWPMKNAPPPPQIYDDIPDDEPIKVDGEYINNLRRISAETYPTPPDSCDTKEFILLRACEEVFQRQINQRIHSDDRVIGLEPTFEPEPHLNDTSSSDLLQLLDKYAFPIPPEHIQKRNKLIGWERLGIQGVALERIKRLFDRKDISDDDDDDDDETGDTNNGSAPEEGENDNNDNTQEDLELVKTEKNT